MSLRIVALALALSACSSQSQTTNAPAHAESTSAVTTPPAPATPAKATKEEKSRSHELVEQGLAVLKAKGKEGSAEAIGLFTDATNENPRSAQAYWELGWAQQIAGDFDGCLQSWETVRSLDPKHPDLDTFTAIAISRRGEKAPEPPPPPLKAPPRRADMRTDLAR